MTGLSRASRETVSRQATLSLNTASARMIRHVQIDDTMLQCFCFRALQLCTWRCQHLLLPPHPVPDRLGPSWRHEEITPADHTFPIVQMYDYNSVWSLPGLGLLFAVVREEEDVEDEDEEEEEEEEGLVVEHILARLEWNWMLDSHEMNGRPNLPVSTIPVSIQLQQRR
ncbi:hypothetical protein M406DRAFT_67008 [Cryphonectria parasitica EP155]|uniref:Uncharacterized protein n=1 Tax=Cryphonectria parasitica (strain ATCC 38755 / EP155) TaxID=660469 RepID=A0A9P4YBQ0_CRYP1|nr:uncharacterized protein M406DRAFT_67008 [Cryphonectria parasitica EP155]KAF3770619.1 hypothetical protein M406DRAFT_67008 [Cryphonectria parasitica EP155]